MSDRQLSEAQILQRQKASEQARLLRELKTNPRGGKRGRPPVFVDLDKIRKFSEAGASVSQIQSLTGLSRGVVQRAKERVKGLWLQF